ncbi:MAG: NADH-quinone reductase [Desulfobacterales bacterium]|nr:NADH-quinone reductase [Desulfobacterales bacterium]
MKVIKYAIILILIGLICGCNSTGDRFVLKSKFQSKDSITITFAGAVDDQWAKNKDNFIVYEEPDPDIRLIIKDVLLSPDKKSVEIFFAEPINKTVPHCLKLKDISSDGKSQGTHDITVKKFYFGNLINILVLTMLVQNIIFVKYLGLCIYLGISRKRAAAIGMGFTFTIVSFFSSIMIWFVYQKILIPFHINFIQIIVFVGLISLTVQFVDTILRKVNPVLFKEFGIYLVLVVSNCAMLAIPLLIAANNYDLFESIMVSLGGGLGFLLALFLMSCVQERLSLSPIPPSFKGMPAAFIMTGLFCLAFMGFSGMALF